MRPGEVDEPASPAVDTSTECFSLRVGSTIDEKLGELRAFGRYWVWGQALRTDASPLRFYEWTPQGVADLTTVHASLHRAPAGVPHRIEGLFGYWLISDADHQWVQALRGDLRCYILIAGGESGVNRRHSVAWYCPECGAALGEPRSLAHDGTPESFLDAQAQAVADFNSDPAVRTCPTCGAVHPEAYGFRAERPSTWSLVPPPAQRTARFGDPIAGAGKIAPGKGLVVALDGEQVALVRDGERLYAIGNECPHKGGPLALGEVRHGAVTCPWHRFRFDLATGVSATNPAMSARTYPVVVDGDAVAVLHA